MPSRRNRRTRRRALGARGPLQQVVEIITFSSGPGVTQVVQRSDLTSVPSSRAFRVSHVECEAVGAIWYNAGTSTTPSRGGLWPSWLQIRIYGPDGATAVATTSGHMLGPCPRAITLRNHPQTDWTPLEAPATHKVIGIDHGCIRGSAPSNVANSGLIRIYVEISREELSEACPTLLEGPRFRGELVSDGVEPSPSPFASLGADPAGDEA